MTELEKRIEALEDAARPPRKSEWLTVFRGDGETLEQAEERQGLKVANCGYVFEIFYDDDEANDGKTQD